MNRYPWTETIAVRTFEFHSAAGAVEPIEFTLGKPAVMPDAPNGDWYCPYRLAISGEVRESYAGGVDAVQAVLLALSKVWAELQHFPKAGAVLWLEGPELGLETIPPQPPN